MIDESIKFAWAYLLLHGVITTGEWSYFGGCFESTYDYDQQQRMLETIRAKATTIGIDWKQTDVPSVENEEEFNGTDSPSSRRLATLGTLVLNNGETYLLGSDRDEAAHLAATARQIIQKKYNPIQELANKL